MGLVLDQDGILITHSVHPGNTADVKTVDSMNKRLRNTLGIENSILVVDGGMISTKNVKQLNGLRKSYRKLNLILIAVNINFPIGE